MKDLQAAVLGVPGIAAAEVESRRAEGPSVRVWLDGSRRPQAVARDVRGVLREAGYGTHTPTGPTLVPPRRNGNGKRSGLGRGLEALIPAAEAMAEPEQPTDRLEMVSIEETAAGTIVRSVAGDGRSAAAPVPNGAALNEAIAATVAGVLGVGVPRLDAVEVREVGGRPVMVVLLSTPDGRQASGSCVVEAGMPFTLGRSVWAALRSVR